MYWHVKLIFGLAALMVVAGTLFAFRGYLAQLPQMALNIGGVVGTEEAEPEANTASQTSDTSEPRTTVDPKLAEARAKVRLAAKHLRENHPVPARKLLDNLLRDPEVERFSPAWEHIVKQLNRVNEVILLSNCPAPEKTTYVVQSGDSLWEIARGNNMTVEHLQRVNEMGDDAHIRPGQTLDLYPADWRIEIYKKERRLLLYDGERLLLTYEVGVGRQDRTPVGTFVIYNRETKPVWNPPGRVIPYGHPDNVLGTRWMGLKASGDTDPKLKGYGIHGTWAPESIGKAESNGCLRMLNEQVEQLFVFVSEGVPVRIHS